MTINNPKNRENQPPKMCFLKVLSDQALAIMANETGRAGNKLLTFFLY